MESTEIKEKVLLALAEIRPFLAADGGDISLVSIEDDRIVSVQLPRSLCRLFSKSDDIEIGCRNDN